MIAVAASEMKSKSESKESESMEDGVTFKIFEEIVKEICLKSMTRKEIKDLKELFDVLNGGKPITKNDMVRLLVKTDFDSDGNTDIEQESDEVSGIVESLFDRWASSMSKKTGEPVLKFDEYVSMISYHAKLEELVYDVRGVLSVRENDINCIT